MRTVADKITIRVAGPDDEAAIARLAALDSAQVPLSPYLLAEVEGELHASLSLADDRIIADPFHPTLHLASLLRVYADIAAPEVQALSPPATAEASS